MSRKTIRKKLVALTVMVAMLFGVYTALPPRYGSALSNSAIDTTIATMTDIPLTPIVPGENEIASTNPNATLTQNAVLQVVVNQPNIDHATIEIVFDEYAYLYGFKNIDISALRANTMVDVTYPDDNGKITISVTNTDAVTQGQRLLRFYFYGWPSPTNPCTHITCSAQAYTANNTPIANAFVYQIALIGNPEYDSTAGESIINGSIDSDDALWILQYVAGKHDETCCPDLELRKLAADTDLDGSVRAADSTLVLKRPTGKNISFLDINRIYEPYGTTVGQTPCQIKDVQTGRYLQRASDDTLRLWNSSLTPNGLFRFEKIAVNTKCAYRIYSLYDDQLLCLDESENLVLTDSGANIKNGSTTWYVIPNGSKYVITNAVAGDRTLGDLGRTANLSQCGMSYLDYGNVWEITPYINLKIYYDGAYAARHTNQTTMQNELVNIRNGMATIIQNAFGATITTTAVPTAHTSLLDTVHGVGNRDNLCSCSGVSSGACRNYLNSTNQPGASVHHTNYVAQLYNLITTKSNGIDYHLLYSGYRNCGRSLEEGSTAHVNDVVAGVATTDGAQVGITFYTGEDTEHRKKITALHELSHMLGAIVDKDELTPDTDHGNCVMSYDRNSSTLLNLWNLVTTDDPTITDETRIAASKALFCEGCTQLINDYL